MPDRDRPILPRSVLLFGGTGTAGRATAAALLAAGHHVTLYARPTATDLPPDARLRFGTSFQPDTLLRQAVGGDRFDAVVSCLASRSGSPSDAAAIDRDAHLGILDMALRAGIPRFVQLSAICLQKPRLPFQYAKLAFEARLMASDLDWTIVRPTAYFKSLSGQIARVQAGKPYLVFGDGRLTACKPISDRDLGRFIVQCLTDRASVRRILPIGGPGPSLTPREMGEEIFRLAGRPARFRRMPVAAMRGIVGALDLGAKFRPALADKAALARIGLYYATESMLVWDEARQRYDANATPEFGEDRLSDHFARVLAGKESAGLGDHAVFARITPGA